MKSETFLIVEILIIVFFVVIIFFIIPYYDMKKNPLYHAWWSVTRCRICEKRVFVWQRRERRNYSTETNNPDNLLISCSSSGIVHKHCKGNPIFNVTVSTNKV
jgi:hypothetical protein